MNQHYQPDLTWQEFKSAIALARKVKAMRGKAVKHTCGDLYCYDPKCLTVVDIRERSKTSTRPN